MGNLSDSNIRYLMVKAILIIDETRILDENATLDELLIVSIISKLALGSQIPVFYFKLT